MTRDVAQMVTTDHSWTIAAVVLILGYCLISVTLTYRYIIGGDIRGFRARLRERARLCLARTGYVGALISRHTVLLTANVLVLNLSLNLLSLIKQMEDSSDANQMLQNGLHVLAAVCIGSVAIIAAITFALCNEIARQAEDEQ